MIVKDGLFKVQFQTPLGMGYGVIYLSNGRIHGGDSTVFYTGTFSQGDGNFTANVKIDTHTNLPGHSTVFGRPNAQITLNGKVTSETAATCQGSSPQAPGVNFQASISRLSD